MTTGRRILTVTALALLTAAAPASAAPQWVGGGQLVAPNDDVSPAPQVALAPNGDAIAVWNQIVSGSIRVVAAVRPAGGAFGPPVPISPSGSS